MLIRGGEELKSTAKLLRCLSQLAIKQSNTRRPVDNSGSWATHARTSTGGRAPPTRLKSSEANQGIFSLVVELSTIVAGGTGRHKNAPSIEHTSSLGTQYGAFGTLVLATALISAYRLSATPMPSCRPKLRSLHRWPGIDSALEASTSRGARATGTVAGGNRSGTWRSVAREGRRVERGGSHTAGLGRARPAHSSMRSTVGDPSRRPRGNMLKPAGAHGRHA